MWRFLLVLIFCTSACVSPQTTSTSSEPVFLERKEGNLILNPGAEIAESASRPFGWSPDSWGRNSSNLAWENLEPFSGSKYLSVAMTNYQDGDAKWIFKAQQLKPDTWYEYSNYYRSDGRSRLVLGCTNPDGKSRFHTVWQADRSEAWKKASFRFYVSPSNECSTTIMHILDRNGYLHTDNHQLLEAVSLPLKQPMVSVTFDDIYASAADFGARKLEKRGWKGTYYITGKYARLAAAPEYAKVEQVKALMAHGHELGSHSDTHLALSTLSNSDVTFNIKTNYDYLKSLGQAPVGIAYPFGDFSAAVEAEVKLFHEYARTSLAGLNDQSADPYRLRVLPVTNTTTNQEILSWIDDAESSSTWLILLFHELTDDIPEETYVTAKSQYEQVLSYLEKNSNIAVLPVNEALKRLRYN